MRKGTRAGNEPHFHCQKLAGANFDKPTHPEGFPKSETGVTVFLNSQGVEANAEQVTRWCELARAAPDHPVDCIHWKAFLIDPLARQPEREERRPVAGVRLTYVLPESEG